MFQSYVLMLQSYKMAILHCCKIAMLKLHCCKIALLHCCYVAMLNCCDVALLRCCIVVGPYRVVDFDVRRAGSGIIGCLPWSGGSSSPDRLISAFSTVLSYYHNDKLYFTSNKLQNTDYRKKSFKINQFRLELEWKKMPLSHKKVLKGVCLIVLYPNVILFWTSETFSCDKGKFFWGHPLSSSSSWCWFEITGTECRVILGVPKTVPLSHKSCVDKWLMKLYTFLMGQDPNYYGTKVRFFFHLILRLN